MIDTKEIIFLKKYLFSLFFLIAFLIFWQLYVTVFKVPEYLLPSPYQIILSTIKNSTFLLKNSVVTSLEILTGFGVGAIAAFILSIAIVYSKSLEKILYPIIILIQGIPKTALAPLFLIWFGYKLLPKIVITALISFFPIVVTTARGLKSINPELIDLMNSLSASKRQILTKIRLPNSIPYLFSGLKISITLSVAGAIVGEFVGANEGLGYVVMLSQINLDTSLMFAAISILSIIGITFFFCIYCVEKIIFRRFNYKTLDE